MDVAAATRGVVNMHMGVTEVIAAVLQRFSHTHVLCYMVVWGAEIGPVAAGPA